MEPERKIEVEEAVEKYGRREYVRYGPDGKYIEAVMCKLCGATIASLRDVDDLPAQVVKTSEGRKNVVRVMLAYNDQYVNMKIAFDDGSAHVTQICKKCGEREDILDLLDDIYNLDLAQFEMDEKRGLGKVSWGLMDKRRPVAIPEISASEM